MSNPAPEGIVNQMEFPPVEDFKGYETFDDAMGAFAEYARDNGKAYFCAWTAWQHYAKLLRPFYPDAPTGKQEIQEVVSALRNKHGYRVWEGPEWTDIVGASFGVFRASLTQAPPPPPSGQPSASARVPGPPPTADEGSQPPSG